MAFRFANIVVASNDVDARYGTPFTPFEHFAPWNVDDDGCLAPTETDGGITTKLELLIFGLFNVERFGQLFTNFTAFDETTWWSCHAHSQATPVFCGNQSGCVHSNRNDR